MNRNLVLQCNNSQNSSLKLLNFAPEPIPVSLLSFTSEWVLQNPDAPLFLQIRTLAQNLFLEIFGKLVLRHS